MNAMRPRVTARPYTYPVGTGGWNAIDALDAMKPDECETLINFFPETTYLRLRRGYDAFSDTGTGLPVKTLAVWSNGVTALTLGASDGDWWDVSGNPGLSVGTGYGSDVWDTVNFSTGGTQYLIAANGVDTPQVFAGVSFTAAVNTIGGAPPAITFNRVTSFNRRLFYAETETLSVWYLPVGQYQGALTEFDFGPVFAKGGYLEAIATWTRDNGFAGANEMFVAVTTEGEVAIYEGSDPASWTLRARFEVGQPVSGPGCITRIGPDMVLICQDGFQPLAHYLQLGESQAQAVALSRKIGNAVTAAVNAARYEDGWGAVLYPQGNMLIFNIPQTTADTFNQYVVNTLTGAWCQWTGQNAYSWAYVPGFLYFGGADGVVYVADTGTSDNGDFITAEFRGSYQYIGGPGLLKRATMAQPVFATTGNLNIAFAIDVDFINGTLTTPPPSVPGAGAWGTGVWGTMVWGGGQALQRPWMSVTGLGYAMAPHFLISTNNVSVNLLSVTVLFERGAFL